MGHGPGMSFADVSRHGNSGMRIERDSLGDVAVPAAAYRGAQTQRAIENYPIGGLRPRWGEVTPVIWIKRCAALSHSGLRD